MAYCVYCHTNKINGKKYIGITSMSVNKRWQNGNGYKNNRHFNGAIQKYGWENFEHKIIFNNLTKEEAEAQEKFLIKLYQTNDRFFGYNISNGGEAKGKHSKETKENLSKLAKERYRKEKNPMYNRKHTKEAKQKMSKALKGRTISEEQRKKLSASLKGRKVSQETRKKLSKALKGKPSKTKGIKRKEETKKKISQAKKISVICLNDKKIFPSITEAAVYYNVDNSSIGKICKGKKKSAKGLVFAFYKRGEALENISRLSAS